jgi:hypothetical protein
VCGDTGYYTYCGYGPITQTAPRPVTPTAPPTLATIPAPAATLRPSKPPPLVLPALIFPTAALSTTSGWHSKWLSQSEYVALTPGQVAAFWIRFLNVGTETWTRGVLGQQVNLALNGDDRAPFRLGMASRWLWEDRLATTATDQTKPGEIAEFRFEIKAPMTAGRYSLSLRPVVEGITWLEDEGVFWIIDVSGQPTAPAPSSIQSTITGSVTDATKGAPLAGVCVSVTLPTTCSSTTNSQGRYTVIADTPAGELIDVWFRLNEYRSELASVTTQLYRTRDQQLTRRDIPLADSALTLEVRATIDTCNDATSSAGLLLSATPVAICAIGSYLDDWRAIVDEARRRKLVTASSLQAIDYVGDVFSTNDGGFAQTTIETWLVQTREQGYVSAPEIEVVPQVYVLRRIAGRLLITENYQWQQ